jgi:hypothetical protein
MVAATEICRHASYTSLPSTELSVEPRQENNEPLMLVQCTFIFRASRENHGSPEDRAVTPIASVKMV